MFLGCKLKNLIIFLITIFTLRFSDNLYSMNLIPAGQDNTEDFSPAESQLFQSCLLTDSFLLEGCEENNNLDNKQSIRNPFKLLIPETTFKIFTHLINDQNCKIKEILETINAFRKTSTYNRAFIDASKMELINFLLSNRIIQTKVLMQLQHTLFLKNKVEKMSSHEFRRFTRAHMKEEIENILSKDTDDTNKILEVENVFNPLVKLSDYRQCMHCSYFYDEKKSRCSSCKIFGEIKNLLIRFLKKEIDLETFKSKMLTDFKLEIEIK